MPIVLEPQGKALQVTCQLLLKQTIGLATSKLKKNTMLRTMGDLNN
jgi:hypothetical protein